jgi:hypothetical protein
MKFKARTVIKKISSSFSPKLGLFNQTSGQYTAGGQYDGSQYNGGQYNGG